MRGISSYVEKEPLYGSDKNYWKPFKLQPTSQGGLMETLKYIQQNINVPKGQLNKFGGYKYRSAEDILVELKKHLGDCYCTLTDRAVMVGERYYIEATATHHEGGEVVSVVAYAREPESKKGMDSAQVSGSCSSYARKFALNGLYLLDDTKDDDTRKPTDKTEPEMKPPEVSVTPSRPEIPTELPEAVPNDAGYKWRRDGDDSMTDGQNKFMRSIAKNFQVSAERLRAIKKWVALKNGLNNYNHVDVCDQLLPMKKFDETYKEFMGELTDRIIPAGIDDEIARIYSEMDKAEAT
jgi:hypothetical protein